MENKFFTKFICTVLFFVLSINLGICVCALPDGELCSPNLIFESNNKDLKNSFFQNYGNCDMNAIKCINNDDSKGLESISKTEDFNLNGFIVLQQLENWKSYQDILCAHSEDEKYAEQTFKKMSLLDYAFLKGANNCLDFIIKSGGKSYSSNPRDIVLYAVASGNPELVDLAKRLCNNNNFTVNDFFVACRTIYHNNVEQRLFMLKKIFENVKGTFKEDDSEKAIAFLFLAEQSCEDLDKVFFAWRCNHKVNSLGESFYNVSELTIRLRHLCNKGKISENFMAMAMAVPDGNLPLQQSLKAFLSAFVHKHGVSAAKGVAVSIIRDIYSEQNVYGTNMVAGFIFSLLQPNEKIPRNTIKYGSALHQAVHYNSSNLIKNLILIGADINEKNKVGNSALTEAIMDNNLKMVKLLLSLGADVHLVENPPFTPLMLAATRDDNEIIKMLLLFGADPEQDIFQILENENKSTNTKILDLIKSKAEKQSLHEAALNGNFTMVKFWIDIGVNVNKVDENGYNALNQAVMSNNEMLVELLLKAGANVHMAGKKVWTPLLLATIKDNVKIINLLLSYGSTAEQDIFGVLLENHGSIKESILPLLKSAASKKSLHEAVKQKNMKLVRLFVSIGVDVNSVDVFGCCALNYAIKNDDVEMIKFLLKSGANVNLVTKKNPTPLRLAISRNNTAIINLLTSYGAN